MEEGFEIIERNYQQAIIFYLTTVGGKIEPQIYYTAW
jgi:hypothetical protein